MTKKSFLKRKTLKKRNALKGGAKPLYHIEEQDINEYDIKQIIKRMYREHYNRTTNNRQQIITIPEYKDLLDYVCENLYVEKDDRQYALFVNLNANNASKRIIKKYIKELISNDEITVEDTPPSSPSSISSRSSSRSRTRRSPIGDRFSSAVRIATNVTRRRNGW